MSVATRSILSNTAYRHLFAAQVIALLGTGFLTVALSLLAFDIAPSAAGGVVATALTIKMVAYVGVAPIVTAVTSRFAARRVLVAADGVRGAVALCLPWVDQVWQIYVLIFVLQAASATFTPTYQATLPAVLPDEDQYTRALSFSRLAYDLEAVVSPMLAAAFLTVLTFHQLFFLTAAGFAGSAMLVLTAGLVIEPRRDDTTLWSRATEGMRLYAHRPALRALIALDVAVAAATALVLVNTVVAIQQDLELGATPLAITLGAYGVGSMLVALTVPAIVRRVSDRIVMLIGAVAAPIALVIAAVATSRPGPWALILMAWLLIGASISAILTPSGRIVNRNAAPAERSGAFAANFSISHACFLLAYPIAGWTGERFGVSVSAVVLACIAAIAATVAITVWRRERSRSSVDVAGSTSP